MTQNPGVVPVGIRTFLKVKALATLIDGMKIAARNFMP
jgi:hypothetical protein